MMNALDDLPESRALKWGWALFALVLVLFHIGLIFSGLWGVLFFGQLPDLWTIVGAAVITGAGIYVWWRERIAAGRD